MANDYRARIRMYRQGLGDCFLLTLPRGEATPFRILIDCGVLLGTANPADVLGRVVADIAQECEGFLDVLVVTHEHWDHVSGFLQAQEGFAGLTIGDVWMAWTEDREDPAATELRSVRHELALALHSAKNHLRSSTSTNRYFGLNSDVVGELDGLLNFHGVRGGSTADAMESAHDLATAWNWYFEPGDQPELPTGVAARAYVLGPPRESKWLKKTRPSSRTPETYHLGAASWIGARELASALDDSDDGIPFQAQYRIPWETSQGLAFFREHYWESYEEEVPADWRRIDLAWLGGAVDLALKLDSATNNTSLVLAFELDNGDVLLFPGDAQVGNWLSWDNVTFKVGRGTVAAAELVARTIVYKVGHHGSHNATLRKKGLERMDKLQFALIPVDESMARKKNWNKMPLNSLVSALEERAAIAVLRADTDVGDTATNAVRSTDLYHEIEV